VIFIRLFLLLPLLLGFSFPVVAHNEANGGCVNHCQYGQDSGVWEFLGQSCVTLQRLMKINSQWWSLIFSIGAMVCLLLI